MVQLLARYNISSHVQERKGKGKDEKEK